jgi:hypothetical protein
MIKDLLLKGIVETPWPVIVDGSRVRGTKFDFLHSCTEACFQSSEDNYSCEHNLNFVSKNIVGVRVKVCQVFIPNNMTPRHCKKSQKLVDRKVSSSAIDFWFSEFEKKSEVLKDFIESTAKKRFDPFHEFVRWAGEIKFYADKLLDKTSFENASENLKSLYKTSVMLNDALDTAAIYVNPESAGFGSKRLTDIYSMVYKIKVVLSHSKTLKGGRKIIIMGAVQGKHNVYESFKIIPLSLLQNAIKYSRTGDIEIVFDERGSELVFSVVSYGDLIPEHEIGKIFTRGYRTEKAKKMAVEGNGLGLYAVWIVAETHGFKVTAQSIPFGDRSRNEAKNVFSVVIR